VIKVLSEATVVANAFTAAKADAALSVIVAEAETLTPCAAIGSEAPPTKLAVIVPPFVGIYTVYVFTGLVSVFVGSEARGAAVVTLTVVKSVADPLPAAVVNEIPPVA